MDLLYIIIATIMAGFGVLWGWAEIQDQKKGFQVGVLGSVCIFFASLFLLGGFRGLEKGNDTTAYFILFGILLLTAIIIFIVRRKS